LCRFNYFSSFAAVGCLCPIYCTLMIPELARVSFPLRTFAGGFGENLTTAGGWRGSHSLDQDSSLELGVDRSSLPDAFLLPIFLADTRALFGVASALSPVCNLCPVRRACALPFFSALPSLRISERTVSLFACLGLFG